MNVLIVEDEMMAQANLARALTQHFPDVRIVGTTGSVRETVLWLRTPGNSADVIFMDVAAVDTKTDQLIRAAFHHEIPDTTKIIIAQRVASVQESDMILVMDHGRIMAAGTHEQLLENCDEYRSIYESQTKNQAQPEELQ